MQALLNFASIDRGEIGFSLLMRSVLILAIRYLGQRLSKDGYSFKLICVS